MKQSDFFKKSSKSYGGMLLNTRKGRSQGRPLDTKSTMHLVLRSSKATGEWSFKKTTNEAEIKKITSKFAEKFGIKILSLANVGNHLHFHIKLSNRFAYKPFIRAITAAIAMAVTGSSRWNPMKLRAHKRDTKCTGVKEAFWDYRPFTRVIQSLRAFLNLRDYIQINQLEGLKTNRIEARFILESMSYRTKYGNSC